MSESHEGRRVLPLQEAEPGLAKEMQMIQAAAQSRVRKSGYPELHFISCEFHEGILTLRGHVSSFYLKQIAQTLIRGLDGVGEINNRLEVAARRSGSTEDPTRVQS